MGNSGGINTSAINAMVEADLKKKKDAEQAIVKAEETKQTNDLSNTVSGNAENYTSAAQSMELEGAKKRKSRTSALLFGDDEGSVSKRMLLGS